METDESSNSHSFLTADSRAFSVTRALSSTLDTFKIVIKVAFVERLMSTKLYKRFEPSRSNKSEELCL